ncbi:MAG: GIY-YIG nuclease family protein, partial [Planctomycetes bacterium]|nr:GIY-YIG nuclease family protein [Planctomycetota bacterium]
MPALPFESRSTEEIPQEPGVYLFLGADKRVLYVGKANDLRSRVRSYFSKSNDHRLVTTYVHREARQLDFIVTQTEKEALL